MNQDMFKNTVTGLCTKVCLFKRYQKKKNTSSILDFLAPSLLSQIGSIQSDKCVRVSECDMLNTDGGDKIDKVKAPFST